jgi:glycosyltransferase involved in cell wall biosynthesis
LNISHISVSNLPVLHRFGGAIERRIVEIAQRQAKRGHRVRVFSIGDQTEFREENGVEYSFLKCRTRIPFRHFEFQYKVVNALKQRPDEVLHFHSQPEGAWMSKGVEAKKLLSYDFFEFRGGDRTPLYHFYKRVLRQFDQLLPVSQFCLKESGAFWGLPTDKMQVLFNGVNTEQFKPDPTAADCERRQIGLDKRVVLYVGRVCNQKGSDVLLEAVKALNERRSDFQLVIAGPIGQFGMKADPNRWVDRIKTVGGVYLGAVEESRLAGIYNLADIFVMPTRFKEMFGMAAVEAQACGKPVVASDCGGLREVVPMNCGGRFPVGSVVELAREIEKLIDDSNYYNSCSADALRNAAQYDWNVICTALDRLYKA